MGWVGRHGDAGSRGRLCVASLRRAVARLIDRIVEVVLPGIVRVLDSVRWETVVSVSSSDSVYYAAVTYFAGEKGPPTLPRPLPRPLPRGRLPFCAAPA